MQKSEITHILKSIPLAAQSLNENGEIIAVNSKWKELFGYDDNEIRGKAYRDFITEKSLETLKENFPKLKKNKKISEVYFDIVTKNGKIIPIVANGRVIECEGCIGTICTLNNIEELAKNKEKINELLQKYKYLYNNIPAMLYTLDDSGKISSVSDYWLEKLEYSREEVIGQDIMYFLTEESRILTKRLLPIVFKTGKMNNSERQFIKKNGEIINCLVYATIIKNKEDKVETLAIITDITEKIKIMDELIRSKIELESIINSAQDMIMSVDSKGNITSWNKSFENKIGLSKNEVLNKNLKELPKNLDELKSLIEKSLLKSQSEIIKQKFLDKYNNIINVVSNISLIKEGGAVLIAREIKNTKPELDLGRIYMVTKMTNKKRCLLLEQYENKKKVSIGRTYGQDCRCNKVMLGSSTINNSTQLLQYIKQNIIDCVFAISNLEYILVKEGFSSLMKLIYELSNEVKINNGLIVLNMNPDNFDKAQFGIISDEVELVQNEQKYLDKKIIDVLKFIKDQNLINIKLQFNHIGKKFGFSKKTVKTIVENLQKQDYINIEKVGRVKYIHTTEKCDELN